MKPKLTYEQYLEDKNPEMVKIARGIEKLVQSVAPKATHCMNPWSTPTYEAATGFFAIYIVANAHVSLGFARAMEIPDPHGLLEGTGKHMRHVKLKSVADLKREGLKEMVAAASKLPGRSMGGASKKGKSATKKHPAVKSAKSAPKRGALI